ncbi:MAG: DUF6882 domain-containing protein [Oscillospiraceae bacterium]
MNNFSVLECPVYFDKTNMLDMLSLSAGRAILCQNRLGEQIIADNSWGLDPMKGMIRFGEREFRAGILGSESEIQNTWLWSWAHTESGLPESSTAVSRRVKKLLPELPEFQTGKFMLDEVHNGHDLAMISCGVSHENICYYRMPLRRRRRTGDDFRTSRGYLCPGGQHGVPAAVYRDNQRILLRPQASRSGIPVPERNSFHGERKCAHSGFRRA